MLTNPCCLTGPAPYGDGVFEIEKLIAIFARWVPQASLNDAHLSDGCTIDEMFRSDATFGKHWWLHSKASVQMTMCCQSWEAIVGLELVRHQSAKT